MKKSFKLFGFCACLIFSLSGNLSGKNNPSHAKMLIQHFFNILTQGALALTAKSPEEQIRATANILESISTIAQMTVDDPEFDDENSKKRSDCAYYSETLEVDVIHNLAAKLHRLCINDSEFMEEFNKQRAEHAARLLMIMNNTAMNDHSTDELHSERVQTD